MEYGISLIAYHNMTSVYRRQESFMKAVEAEIASDLPIFSHTIKHGLRMQQEVFITFFGYCMKAECIPASLASCTWFRAAPSPQSRVASSASSCFFPSELDHQLPVVRLKPPSRRSMSGSKRLSVSLLSPALLT
jgi:hypothetical protein